VETGGLKTVALELSNLEKNWFPLGVIDGIVGYVPGPGVFTDIISTLFRRENNKKYEY